MLSLASILDTTVDRSTGVVMVASGAFVLWRRRSAAVGVLLSLAGASWLLPVISIGRLSTLFVHRPLLAGALAIAAQPRWRRPTTTVPLAALAMVSAAPKLTSQRALIALSWGAVLTVTAVSAWPSPRRLRVLPALGAQVVMFTVAVLAPTIDLFTADERRIVYSLATLLAAALTARVATAPISADVVLDDRPGRAWAVALRPHGSDTFRLAGGAPATVEAFTAALEFEFGDLGTGLLMHDDPGFDAPSARPRLREAVRLACERIDALRRIDEQRLEVAASQARLVEADRRASAMLRHDITRIVVPHLDAIDDLLGTVPTGTARASRLLAEIRREVDDLATGSTPEELEAGLSAALRSLAARSSLEATVHVDDPLLDHGAAIALYMAASEAVANTAKHSGGSRVRIELLDGDPVVLRVSDDGRGGAIPTGAGGLRHLHDRVAALGGTVTVESPVGQGTTVTVEMPARPS